MFDENGEFIEGYYIVGLLAEFFLKQYPSEKIIHDPRLIWNTVDIVTKNGGTAIETKTGHAFIKERMRKENAIYGGEMSAHHYFRDFGYCDSGMIPWLLIIELISRSNQPLSTYVNQQMKSFPSSGEINRNVSDPDMLIDKVNKYYQNSALSIKNIDGLSMSFEHWRLNLRKSNTESLLRLNVETKGCKELLANKVKEILSIVD